MAFTVSGLGVHNGNEILGDLRVRFLRVTADGAEDAIDTGLSIIDQVNFAPQSLTTGAAKLKINALSSGTASVGKLAITGVATGDVMFVTVYGR